MKDTPIGEPGDADLADLAELSPDDRTSLLHMLDALVTKNRLKPSPANAAEVVTEPGHRRPD